MKLFLAFLQMVPAIIQLVQQVEAAIPAKGKGPEKLNLVLSTVQAAAGAAPQVAALIPPSDLAVAVTNIVNATVATLNAVQAPAAPAAGQ